MKVKNITSINDVTTIEKDENISIITLNSPPVNALSATVREGLYKGITKARNDKETEAIIIICEGRTFIAGADISEFGKEPKGPSLFEVQEFNNIYEQIDNFNNKRYIIDATLNTNYNY